MSILDPTYIDPRIDCRSISFENPTGARGAGGTAHDGRKGHPFYVLEPGEKSTLADIEGTGTIRHIWMAIVTLPAQLSRPETLRALRFEVFYDGSSEPSISVPLLDFFGLPHGRMAEYYSELVCINEGRALNSYIPMPFKRSIRVELTNESNCYLQFCQQIDYTLEPHATTTGYLHATFHRENPTELRKDFTIAEGFRGPGRFLGCSVGIRLLEKDVWYGEGEVKIYRDGDGQFPTYCGSGLEDYVGSALGLGRHYGKYCGAPLFVPDAQKEPIPHFMSFYRWHLPDPIMFSSDLRVTIQQIGCSPLFDIDKKRESDKYWRSHLPAGPGVGLYVSKDKLGMGLVERSDDYCATAFVYCNEIQPVPRYYTDLAVCDIEPVEGESYDEIVQPEAIMRKIREYWLS